MEEVDVFLGISRVGVGGAILLIHRAGRVWRRSRVWMGVGAPRGRDLRWYMCTLMCVLWARFLHPRGGGRGGLWIENAEGYYIHVSTLIERPGSRHWVVG